MENLEDDLNNEQIATSANELEVITSTVSENLDSSVELIEPTIEVLDLSSASSLNSTSSPASSAGIVGSSNDVGSGGLIKPKQEAAFKNDTTGNAESPTLDSTLDQNPSTSTRANTSSATGVNVLECPICLQTCIHPARLPCGHIFCFLCVKGVAYKNRRCAMCRREIPPEFLDHPQLVNGIEDICTTKATDDGYQWFYEGRNGGWWAYEKRNAREIEDAYQKLLNEALNPTQVLKSEVKKEKKANTDEDCECDSDEDIARAILEYEDYSDDEEGEDDYWHINNDFNKYCFNLQICGNMYTVDFRKMVQYPQNMPYRKRKICRAKGVPCKGVAGLLRPKRNRRMRPY